MTKKQVEQDFKASVLPEVIKKYGKDDKPAKSEAWNDYTDSLCKDGQITDRQYNNWVNPF